MGVRRCWCAPPGTVESERNEVREGWAGGEDACGVWSSRACRVVFAGALSKRRRRARRGHSSASDGQKCEKKKQDEDGDCRGLGRQVGATSDRSSKPPALLGRVRCRVATLVLQGGVYDGAGAWRGV